MASILDTGRVKTRNFEVCRLTLNKDMKNADPSLIYWRDWYSNNKLHYRQYYQRTKNGIYLFNATRQSTGYEIAFNEVTLPFGIRYQFTCPRCNKSSRILYLSNDVFVCRSCSGVTYDSTHSSDVVKLINKVKNSV